MSAFQNFRRRIEWSLKALKRHDSSMIHSDRGSYLRHDCITSFCAFHIRCPLRVFLKSLEIQIFKLEIYWLLFHNGALSFLIYAKPAKLQSAFEINTFFGIFFVLITPNLYVEFIGANKRLLWTIFLSYNFKLNMF